MSFPDVDGSFETFFEPTRIWLFGKPFRSLIYDPDSMGRRGELVGEFSPEYVPSADGTLPLPPKRLERTLRRGVKVDSEGNVQSKRNANSKGEDEEPLQRFFARIYSFTYEAHYYRLPRPLLFLLNSEGQPIGGSRESEADEEAAISSLGPARADQLKQARAARQKGAKGSSAKTTASAGGGGAHQSLAFSAHRFSAKYTGVEARDWDFSSDIRVWAVDRKDLTVCLDIEIANYQEILLDSMITSDRPEEERAARSRGDIISRGAGSFRGDMIGPHQNKFR